MNSNRTTIVLGAGSAIEIGGPRTDEITEAVKNVEQCFSNTRRFFIREISKVLEDYYSDQKPNFEDIFHALEQIRTYTTAWRKGTAKEFRPAFGAFVAPIVPEIFSDNIMINLAIDDLINCVAEIIFKYDEVYLSNPENKWHRVFWTSISAKSALDIITLNYDTCIEKIIPSYNDGFEKTEHEFKKFNPKRLIAPTTETKILHMHGCIHYGYAKIPNFNQYTLTSNHEELYCYCDYKKSKSTWGGRSTNVSQSGESAIMGPLITGLYKADKLQTLPYSFYNSELANIVTRNSSLLIIGYSFSDKHISRCIETVARLHGNKRRIVFILQIKEEIWHPDDVIYDYMNREMFSNICMAFQEDTVLRNLHYKNPVISKDGCARVYFKGFKETAEEHQIDIIQFLNS